MSAIGSNGHTDIMNVKHLVIRLYTKRSCHQIWTPIRIAIQTNLGICGNWGNTSYFRPTANVHTNQNFKHFLGRETADDMLGTASYSSDLGLDSILPHGEVLLTLLFPLRLQRKLQDKQKKMSGHIWLKNQHKRSITQRNVMQFQLQRTDGDG